MKQPKHRPLSQRELKWIARLQKVLNACPTKRLGFYTIGDPDLMIYDRRFDDFLNQESDFCIAVEDAEADLEMVRFPAPVHSTAG